MTGFAKNNHKLRWETFSSLKLQVKNKVKKILK